MKMLDTESASIDPGKNILVVENDQHTAAILGAELEILRIPKGQQRFEANLEGALGAIKTKVPNLTILDLILPDEPGTLLFEPAYREAQGIPTLNILVISADLTPGLTQSLKNRGAVHCLSKPFNIDEFDQVVLRYMR